MSERPHWMYRQSAVVPYRAGADGLELLLITSRKGTRWVLPKGVVEPGMSPAESAAKEAEEEAGVRGVVDPTPLGTYRYNKWGGTCTVEVFAMGVIQEMSEWPESAIRQRAWLPPEEARDRVREAGLKDILEDLTARLGG